MEQVLLDNLNAAGAAIIAALSGLAVPLLFFSALGLIIRRQHVLSDIRRILPETSINIGIFLFNIVFITPFIAGMAIVLDRLLGALALPHAMQPVWSGMPNWLVIFAVVFVGDFVGYWRHRVEHSRILWPAHSIHHSDKQMTWLTLERMHPVNRLTTFTFDSAFLILLGFPAYAVIANNIVRHYYGFFVHSDLPWTYGPLGRVFVSPAMHRWHHAMEPRAFNANFATVFSVFDQWFGTFYAPGPCTRPLGVTMNMGEGIGGQLSYPFRPRAYAALFAPAAASPPREAELAKHSDRV